MFLRIFFLCFCSLSLLSSNQQEINQKIAQNKTALENQKKKEQQVNKKLQEVGNRINIQKDELQSLQKTIQSTENSITKNQKAYSQKESLIQTLTNKQTTLHKEQKRLESEIINLVSQDISFSILLNDLQPESIQDLVIEESFQTINQITKTKLAELSKQQINITKNLAALQEEITNLQNFIQEENKKREKLKNLQTKQIQVLKNYQQEMEKYNKELRQIIQERDAIQEILAQLNILKKQEEKPTKKDQDNKNTFDVRQIASSYHTISTTKYKGKKTIAPLSDFEIEKRFGPYYDPVYKMRVFNESITLITKGDDKVKSVLDGKVVFAKDTPILKKVVIIEHKDNMHTIYAQLDKIAPTIKPGSLVKKGYTIGRVNNILKFEVTSKDKHIDPLELIVVN